MNFYYYKTDLPSTLHFKGLLSFLFFFLIFADTYKRVEAAAFFKYGGGGGCYVKHNTGFNDDRTTMTTIKKFSLELEECTNIHPFSKSNNNNNKIWAAHRHRHHRPLNNYHRTSLRTHTTTNNNNCFLQCPECLAVVNRGGHLSEDSTSSIIAEAAAASVRSGLHPSTSTTTTPYGIPLQIWKIIMQIGLTSINVFFWLIPLQHSNEIFNNKMVLSIANSFSGGVFLSLAFGHLIPECVHGFEGYNNKEDEALPYMLVLAGYMLIFFVEKVAFDAHSLMNNNLQQEQQEEQQQPQPKNSNNNDSTEINESTYHGGRGAVILLGALAVHSVLEMTALGLANTFGKSALLSLSIALHQPAESIALLVAFLKSGMPKAQIIQYLTIFSTCGPIGVTIGMLVQSFAVPIIDAIMLAIVAGTFVYVGATEVIPEEFDNDDEGDGDNKWKKFIALLSGIGSIFIITQYTQKLESIE